MSKTIEKQTTAPITLLGPQNERVTLGEVFRDRSISEDGPIVTITAGWQEREPEDVELDSELDGRSLNLELHLRFERVLRRDEELAREYRRTQSRLIELERHYTLRLSHAMDAVLSLLRETGDADLLDEARKDAVRALRELDAWHLGRVDALRADFSRRLNPWERPAVADERHELEHIVDSAAAVAIAGGHVAVLLNRLRFFGVGDMIAAKPILAWSAGAMVLTDRVVVFHDRPPQGGSNAAILERGLGLCPRLVALPHGRSRLELEDRVRVARFAQRFAPCASVVLSPGDRLDFDGKHFQASQPAQCLGEDGRLMELRSW